MRKSISIIIPVFNAEQTLPKTLASVNESISLADEFDWSVLAIDDGSTDKSVAILNQWVSKLPLQIMELTHTGSPAEPRNHGIESSNSDYLFFLDADDVLLPNGLKALVDFAILNDSDVVLSKLKSLDGRGVPRGMFSENQDQATLMDSRIYWALNPMKLIKRSLLIENGIRFDIALKRDEDQPFSFRSYLAAKRISILANPPTVGVRYSPSGSNLTLRTYEPSDLFQYLKTMTDIMDSANLEPDTKFFLLIRNWEIEISREFIWKRLALFDQQTWLSSYEELNLFSKSRLVVEMLPKTSIRWRGIVGLIGSGNKQDFVTLLKGRKLVIENKNFLCKLRGLVISNWIRLKNTVRLPKSF